MNKKKFILTIGTITTAIAPIALSISCSKGGTDSDTNSGLGVDTNTKPIMQTQKISHKYPTMTEQLRQSLLPYAQKFLAEKGFDHFKDNPSAKNSHWDDAYVNYPEVFANNQWIVFKISELYDFAHSEEVKAIEAWNKNNPNDLVDPETGKFTMDGSQKRADGSVFNIKGNDSHRQPFPYLD